MHLMKPISGNQRQRGRLCNWPQFLGSFALSHLNINDVCESEM